MNEASAIAHGCECGCGKPREWAQPTYRDHPTADPAAPPLIGFLSEQGRSNLFALSVSRTLSLTLKEYPGLLEELPGRTSTMRRIGIRFALTVLLIDGPSRKGPVSPEELESRVPTHEQHLEACTARARQDHCGGESGFSGHGRTASRAPGERASKMHVPPSPESMSVHP